MDLISITQMLGNVGEFVGAIAVVLTLIFLAVQVRHNTNAVAGSTEMELAREMTAWHARITADPELIQLYEKSAKNEPMTDEQATRYRWVIAELLWLYEGVYRQYRRGLISAENWENVVATMVGLLRTEVVRTWWEARTSGLSGDFVAHINKRLADDTGTGWRQRAVAE
jgi:hypothetical protein